MTTSARGDQLVERRTHVAPASTNAGLDALIIASLAITVMPTARASFAVSWPMEPKPTMPSVLPPISRPLPSAPRGHWPAATAGVDW